MSHRGPAAAEIRLSDDDHEVLVRWAQGSSRRAVRARIVLACAEPGSANAPVAAALGVSQPTVICWRRRFEEAGLAGLADAERSGRPKAGLELSDEERAQLTRWARQARTEQVLALRARIVLACAAGRDNKDVAAELRVTEATVARWRRRYITSRLDGLADQPRPGRPPSIPPEKVQEVITATLHQTPEEGTHWSRASMARRSGLSTSTIGRIWRQSGLRPHLAGESTISAGPLLFAHKAVDVAGLDSLARHPTKTSPQPNGRQKKLLPRISDAGHHESVLPPGQTGPAGYRVKQGGTMLAAERRDLLLARLRRDGKLIARDLAAELGLSDDSVRRDLRELAAAGLCQRVYGGALRVSPALGPHASRSGIAWESKRRVGATAAGFITQGITAILDGGTTALEVVAALPPDLDATIITHSPTTAAALARHPKVTVFMLSGQLHKQSVCALGATAAEAANGITADLALLTMPGIHPYQGLTAAEPEEAALRRILISRAASTYAMASIEKLGTVCASKVIGLPDVAGIIADAPADHPIVRQLRDQGATIIQAT